MLETWSVGVLIRAATNAAQTFTQIGRAAGTANAGVGRYNESLRTTAQRQAALTAQIARTNQVAGVVSAGFKGLALASGAAIVGGIKGAADLQNAMTNVAIATGTATDKMGDFYTLAFKMSGMTAQSVTTIAKEMSVAASSGIGNPKQLMTAFPSIAKAADVLWLSPKHLNPVESVKQMTQLSHLFGAYQGTALQHMLDRTVQMMFVQPEGVQQLIAQGRMFIGGALARGVSEDDIFKQAMTMGQTGFLRSRGGSGLARVIEYLSGSATMTGHLSKIQHAAMASLGLTGSNGVLSSQFVSSKGDLLLGKVVDHLEHIRKNFAPMQFGNLLSNAFLAQGGRYMATILLPSVYSQAQKNWEQMQAVGGVDKNWLVYTKMFTYQWNVFATNFQNLFKTIFLPLLPQMTSLLKNWGAALGNAVMYLSKHPKEAALIGKGMFGVFGASVAGIIGTSLIAAANVWRLNRALAALSVTSAAGGAGAVGGAARVGIIGGIGSFIGSIFSGQLFRSVILAVMLRGGVLSGIIDAVVGIGSKAIPIVGWILAAVTAINGIAALVRNGPQIATAIHNWWVKNQYSIGYTIGVAFASIGKLLQSAIMGLYSGAKAAVSTLVMNSWELLTPNGQSVLAAQMALAQQQAQKQWLYGPGSMTFGSGLQSGINSVFGSAPAPTVNLYLNDPNFHFPNGTTPEHAKKSAGEFFDEMLQHARVHTKTTGIQHPTSPYYPSYAFGSP